MTHALAPVAALLLSVALLLAGNGLLGTLLPVRAHIESFSTLEIGLLGTGYFIGFAAGCLSGPHLVQRAGHARAFLAMSAVASAIPLIHALTLFPWLWTIMRTMTGFCLAVLYIVIESWLNERSSNETRGTVLSVYQIINMTVLLVGMMMTTLYNPAGFELFLLASILVSMAAVPVGFTGASTPAPVKAVPIRVKRLFKLSPVGFVGCATVGLANGSFWALGPLYAQKMGMPISGVALYMSAAVLGGAIAQWPIGKLSDRVDRRWVIIAICLVGGAVELTLGTLLVETFHFLLALSVAYGMFAFPLYPVALAHTNDFVSKEDFVEASSGLLLVFAAGASIGPLIAASLIKFHGAPMLYVWTAACHIAMAAFALDRIRVRPAPANTERTEFSAAMEAAQTVSVEFEPDVNAPDPSAPAEITHPTDQAR